MEKKINVGLNEFHANSTTTTQEDHHHGIAERFIIYVPNTETEVGRFVVYHTGSACITHAIARNFIVRYDFQPGEFFILGPDKAPELL